MLKQKLFPLISTAFLIASCSNEPSLIKLNRPVVGNIGLTSGTFTAKKGKRLTFTLNYNNISQDFIKHYQSSNFFNFNDAGTGGILIDFIDESAKDGIKITYHTPTEDIIIKESEDYKHDIPNWTGELLPDGNIDKINNTYVYGSIFPEMCGNNYKALLFCHTGKSTKDSVDIEVTSNDYHKNTIAHFIAGIPLL